MPNMPNGTNTMHFIHPSAMPGGRKGTYLKVIVIDKPHKEIKDWVRATVDGDRVNYPGETSTKISDLVTVKLLLNSTPFSLPARSECRTTSRIFTSSLQ
jgi:hypothetical protein